jgi:hypothetical protein
LLAAKEMQLSMVMILILYPPLLSKVERAVLEITVVVLLVMVVDLVAYLALAVERQVAALADILATAANL